MKNKNNIPMLGNNTQVLFKEKTNANLKKTASMFERKQKKHDQVLSPMTI